MKPMYSIRIPINDTLEWSIEGTLTEALISYAIKSFRQVSTIHSSERPRGEIQALENVFQVDLYPVWIDEIPERSTFTRDMTRDELTKILKALLGEGKKIIAIKMFKGYTGWSLKASKGWIDAYGYELRRGHIVSLVTDATCPPTEIDP